MTPSAVSVSTVRKGWQPQMGRLRQLVKKHERVAPRRAFPPRDMPRHVRIRNQEVWRPEKAKGVAHLRPAPPSPITMEMKPYVGPREDLSTRFRVPHRRAAALLTKLQDEMVEERKKEIELPKFRAGDAVEVVLINKKKKKGLPYDVIRGVVTAIRSRSINSTFQIISNVDGEGIEHIIPTFSPVIAEIRVLRQGFVKDGKRVRRRKLYHLRDVSASEYRIKPHLGPPSNLPEFKKLREEEEKAAAMEAQRKKKKGKSS